MRKKLHKTIYKGNDDYLAIVFNLLLVLIITVIWIINDFNDSIYYIFVLFVVILIGYFSRYLLQKNGSIFILLLPIAIICYLSYSGSNYTNYKSFNWVYVLFFITLVSSVNFSLVYRKSHLIFMLISLLVFNVYIDGIKENTIIGNSFTDQFVASFIKLLTSTLLLYYFILYFIDLSISYNSIESLQENTIVHSKIIDLNIKSAKIKEAKKNEEVKKSSKRFKHIEDGILLYKKISSLNKNKKEIQSASYDIIIKEISRDINASLSFLFAKSKGESDYLYKVGYAASSSKYKRIKYPCEYVDRLFDDDNSVVISNQITTMSIIKSHLGKYKASSKVMYFVGSKYINGLFEFYFLNELSDEQKSELNSYLNSLNYFLSLLLENISLNNNTEVLKKSLSRYEREYKINV